MALLYPQIDPWVPPVGEPLSIPTFWVLPPTKLEQLVINIPELRLYFFEKKAFRVQTYPISIGNEGWETPVDKFSITEKRTNPTWYVPKSLQEKYGMSVMPHGPDNPLGEFIMKFSSGDYGIHGTHMPWGVGRLVSHGCIRCYPEHIRLLYPQVKLGTKVEIVYEPIKFGKKDGQIFVEVHPDVYGRLPDFDQYAAEKLKSCKLADYVDPEKYKLAVRLKNGMPTDVTFSSKDCKQDVSGKTLVVGDQGSGISTKR
jgi:L,D-transpeptidase ErfK/SrfK